MEQYLYCNLSNISEGNGLQMYTLQWHLHIYCFLNLLPHPITRFLLWKRLQTSLYFSVIKNTFPPDYKGRHDEVYDGPSVNVKSASENEYFYDYLSICISCHKFLPVWNRPLNPVLEHQAANLHSILTGNLLQPWMHCRGFNRSPSGLLAIEGNFFLIIY